MARRSWEKIADALVAYSSDEDASPVQSRPHPRVVTRRSWEKIADALVASSSDEDASPVQPRPRLSSPVRSAAVPKADIPQAEAGPARAAQPAARCSNPAPSTGDAASATSIATSSVDGVRDDASLAAALGLQEHAVGAFMFNIGVRGTPVEHQERSVRGTRRLWRWVSEGSCLDIVEKYKQRGLDASVFEFSKFQAAFDMRALEDIVTILAEAWTRNYIGVTTDLHWRWVGCRAKAESTNMVAHVDRGFTRMYCLHVNYGANIKLIESHLSEVLQERPFRYRHRNENGRRYVPGPIQPGLLYFMYLVVA